MVIEIVPDPKIINCVMQLLRLHQQRFAVLILHLMHTTHHSRGYPVAMGSTNWAALHRRTLLYIALSSFYHSQVVFLPKVSLCDNSNPNV